MLVDGIAPGEREETEEERDTPADLTGMSAYIFPCPVAMLMGFNYYRSYVYCCDRQFQRCSCFLPSPTQWLTQIWLIRLVPPALIPYPMIWTVLLMRILILKISRQ